MTPSGQDMPRTVVVPAIEQNLYMAWVGYGRAGAHLHDEPHLTRVTTGIPVFWFNAVVRTALTPDTVDSTIDATLGHFKEAGVPFLWYALPSSRPADLGSLSWLLTPSAPVFTLKYSRMTYVATTGSACGAAGGVHHTCRCSPWSGDHRVAAGLHCCG